MNMVKLGFILLAILECLYISVVYELVRCELPNGSLYAVARLFSVRGSVSKVQFRFFLLELI